MYLMYVDESGDPGQGNSPTKYFVLSAIVVHESKWQDILDDLIVFRRRLKARYGLLMTEEIHASVLINGKSNLRANISRNDKLQLLKDCLQWLDSRPDISIFSVRKDKGTGTGIFEFTWSTLIQRFENTLSHQNFPNSAGNDKGLLIADNTDGGKLTGLLRKLRKINYVPHTAYYGGGSRNMALKAVIEDPIMRDSATSYFHQMVDVVVYFARQYYEPNKYVRNKGARTFYPTLLKNVINPWIVRGGPPHKIVEI